MILVRENSEVIITYPGLIHYNYLNDIPISSKLYHQYTIRYTILKYHVIPSKYHPLCHS